MRIEAAALRRLRAILILPPGNGPVGVGSAAVDFSAPLFVAPGGDIYLATAGRGIVQLKKTR